MYQPLAFIVAVSALRAMSEDISKHRADEKRNSYPYDVLKNESWVPIRSGDLAVGDIIRIKQNDMIPADILFIGSSSPKGHCFIDKANLNGETKLEVYSSIRETRGACPVLPDSMRGEEAAQYIHDVSPADLAKISFTLTYEPPNKKFDSFRGVLRVKDKASGSTSEVKLDGKSLLMRETNLKNTHFAYGLVVYTGNDTKIQRSNLEGEKPKVKVSRVMRDVNSMLKYMFVAQLIFCVVGGILAGSWAYRHVGDWYMAYEEDVMSLSDAAVTSVLALFTWFINLSQMVPISLIVSGEMVKFAMSLFINQDISMYHDPIKKKSKCNTSTIHEDLGMIDYIFSDKTGTLTQNKMEFRYMLLPSGFEFGSKMTEIAKAVAVRNDEIQQRKNGTFAPKPLKRWTTIVKPYVMPRDVDEEEGHDQECCVRYCPNFFHKCWVNPKPHNDAVHGSNVYQAPRTQVASRESKAGPIKAPSAPTTSLSTEPQNESNEPPVNTNVFSEAERRVLLNALYGPRPPSMSETVHSELRSSLHLYMLNMALSNTIKPYYDDSGLQFQPESAEELAMAKFSHSCGYTRLPEKEEKDKTPEEKESSANIRLAIQAYDQNLNPVGEPKEHRYLFLAVLGFTSARARVTVAYEEEATGQILIMIKGQDTTVLPFVKLPAGDKYEEDLLSNLQAMGNNGLRTLVAGHATKPRAWWSDIWGPKYVALRDNPISDDRLKTEMEHALFEQIERDADFSYAGCLGMEDQLQFLVPETIQACLTAGVKVWMITGDKLDTAKNIALACNLIDADMQPKIEAGIHIHEAMSTFSESRLINVTGEWHTLFENRDELGSIFDALDYDNDGLLAVEEVAMLLSTLNSGIPEVTIHAATTKFFPTPESMNRGLTFTGFMKLMSEFKRTLYEAVLYDVEEGIARYERIEDHEAYPISLLVNRDAFTVMFPGKLAPGQSPDPTAPTEGQLEMLRDKFFYLASLAKSVVFARAQPAMKKKMVTEIQARIPSAITLAIGDGANDTDMITAAHVGVGIAGVEGTAATNSSDYALGTFRMLHTLLFVHGFWSYHRVSALVCFIFYKAVLLAVTQYIFGFVSGFSGQQFYNDPIYQLYNVVFTSLPIISLAILDKPLPKNTCEDNPAAFREQKHKAFNYFVFFSWIFRSVVHSLIIFFLPLLAYGYNDITTSDGTTTGYLYYSTTVFFAAGLLPNFLILFLMQSIQIFHIITIFLSILAVLLIIFLMNIPPITVMNKALRGIISRMYSSPSFWLTLILTIAIPLIVELLYLYMKRQLRPSFTHILQEKIALARAQEKHSDSQISQSRSKGYNIPISQLTLLPGVELTSISLDGRPKVVVERPLITPDDETKWNNAKGRQGKVNSPITHATNAFGTSATSEGITIISPSTKEEQLRSALIRTILRFRNQTGSQFDSAASAKYHNTVTLRSHSTSDLAPLHPFESTDSLSTVSLGGSVKSNKALLPGKNGKSERQISDSSLYYSNNNSTSHFSSVPPPPPESDFPEFGEQELVQTLGSSIRSSASSSVDGNEIREKSK